MKKGIISSNKHFITKQKGCNTMKKLLSVVLTIAMVLGTMGTVAFAADSDVAEINGTKYQTLADALANVGEGEVVIELLANAELAYNAREAYGLDVTKSITINGNGNTLTLNQKNSDWSSIGMANSDGTFIMKDVTVDKTGYGATGGAWNTHAIQFNVNVNFTNVTFNNSIKLGGADSVLTNVTINENGGFYGIWIEADGQNVEINGGSIVAPNGGRGIKVADEYVADQAAQVTLNVTDMKFTTAKKAAILVTSTAGADITVDNIDISNCAADSENAVWVDEDRMNTQKLVTVTGASKMVEGVSDDYIKWIQAELLAGRSVTLDQDIVLDDIDYVKAFPAVSNGNGKYSGFNYGNGAFFNVIGDNVTFDLNGHSITYNIHDDEWCNKRILSIFYVTDKANLTINDSVGTGAVTVYGMASAVYSVAADAKVEITGGTWTWNPCATCDASNVFLYASHGGEIYIQEGSFDNNVTGDAGDYMIMAHYSSKETTENSAGVDYDATKIEISGGTFYDCNPGEIMYMDKGTSNSSSKGDGCAEEYMPADNGDGSYGLKAVVAKIGDTKYGTLADAMNAAVDGDIIEVADGTHNLTEISNKTITIKGSKDAVIDRTETVTMSGSNITFDGVTISATSGINYIGLHHAASETYKNCTINGELWTYGVAAFDNCVFNQTSSEKYNIWTYGAETATFTDCKFYSAGKAVLVYKEKGTKTLDAYFTNCEFYASEAVAGKAAIEIDSSLNPFDVKIDNCSAVGFDAGSVSGDVLWNLKKGDSANCSVTIDGVAVNLDEKTTTPIKVVFEPVAQDAKEDEVSDLYNINLTCDSDINRLNSADLTFDFNATVTDGAMDYEIIAVEDITVTQSSDDADRYMFNYKGKDGVVDTGKALTIAQVKVTGYGKYTFAVKAAATNAVHATTIANNLVDTYVSEGATAQEGKLDIKAGISETEITVPTRELTINITFPNAVANNEATYQDMTVTIVGGTVNEEIALGTDAEAYNFTKALPYNTAYTVTVSGAGYRTASYTVNLTEAKTLNFWNNVMDNALEVEVGKANSAVTKNFLAGDIVKDGEINIYDLSAVVSYFGEDNLVEDHPEYAKYDLNRDGKIDSKDVAYVLVSWGE